MALANILHSLVRKAEDEKQVSPQNMVSTSTSRYLFLKGWPAFIPTLCRFPLLLKLVNDAVRHLTGIDGERDLLDRCAFCSVKDKTRSV